MKKNVKQAHDAWRDAEKALHSIQDEYAAKRAELEERYRPRLDKAGDEAHRLQKVYCDTDAAQTLADRDDLDAEGKQALADNLGLTLPE